MDKAGDKGGRDRTNKEFCRKNEEENERKEEMEKRRNADYVEGLHRRESKGAPKESVRQRG